MSAFDENPFADPSVQQATAANPGQSTASLDNYDPFSQQKTPASSAGEGPIPFDNSLLEPTLPNREMI